MTKTIEFVEREIKNIKELFELDDVLCLKTDEDYKFWHNRLQILEQIKCELEAWEVVKDKQVDLFDVIKTKNYQQYKKENIDLLPQYLLTQQEYKSIKKALEV